MPRPDYQAIALDLMTAMRGLEMIEEKVSADLRDPGSRLTEMTLANLTAIRQASDALYGKGWTLEATDFAAMHPTAEARVVVGMSLTQALSGLVALETELGTLNAELSKALDDAVGSPLSIACDAILGHSSPPSS